MLHLGGTLYIFAPADFQRTFPLFFNLVISLQIHDAKHPRAHESDAAAKGPLRRPENARHPEKLIDDLQLDPSSDNEESPPLWTRILATRFP
jgi:hypothetical protein